MKKVILFALTMLFSVNLWALTDPCANLSAGTWSGVIGWPSGSGTAKNLYDPNAGTLVIAATWSSGQQVTPLIGYCLNGNIIVEDYNSIYYGTISGDHISLAGRYIPEDGRALLIDLKQITSKK